MTRTQKKCLVASAGMHGLLGLVLLVTAAFKPEPDITEEQVLTILSPRILDVQGSGGEASVTTESQKPAEATPPAPEETAPKTRSTAPSRPAELQRPKPSSSTSAAQEKPSASIKPSTKTHLVTPSFDPVPVTRSATSAKNSSPSETPMPPAVDNRSSEIATEMSDLERSVRASGAKATVVTLPGEGGGEAFVGYQTFIYNAYYRAWKAPEETGAELSSADVKIVVARDGSIISAELSNPSGQSAMDRSVRRALDAVKKLPPFPESSQDAQRSFTIRFSLEGKQSSG